VTAVAASQIAWLEAWPKALEAWSKLTQLRDPIFFGSDREAQSEQMAGQIAAIRLVDQMVMINLAQIEERRLGAHALAILAHEIGHHVYVPGNLADNARLLAAVLPVLKGLSGDVPAMVANLYADLLVNDRLQRQAGIDEAAVYRALKESSVGGIPSQAWLVYTRAYEHLWRLEPGTLVPGSVPLEMNADAMLISRLIRHFAVHWLRGARRFATVMFPYLRADEAERRAQTFIDHGLSDTRGAGRSPGAGDDAIPDGLTDLGDGELGDDDDFDAELDEELGETERGDDTERRGRARRRAVVPPNSVPEREGRGHKGQCREPFQYGELLRALGLKLTDHEITTRYYRERALPHLIPFPARSAPQKFEPQHEGYETWEAGQPLEDLDVMQTLLSSPVVVPGVSTLQRVYGEAPGQEAQKTPLDLDIYVDSSGSMPNPGQYVSYLALAGTILALSALRAGARVQATVWSGAGQFDTTAGFVRDETKVLGIVTGYICGATAFPLHVLRDSYEARHPTDPPAHVVIISDSGVDTMLEKDERQVAGKEVVRRAMAKARGGGTLALNLSPPWHLQKTFTGLGFRVHYVTAWEELIAFARAFVRENYA
jgi:hypothetical protein